MPFNMASKSSQVQKKNRKSIEKDNEIMQDAVVGESVACMNEIAQKYDLVYIGARSNNTVDITRS